MLYKIETLDYNEGKHRMGVGYLHALNIEDLVCKFIKLNKCKLIDVMFVEEVRLLSDDVDEPLIRTEIRKDCVLGKRLKEAGMFLF